jgi:ribonuclease Z
VIKSWYEQVHNSQPAPPASPRNAAESGELDWESVFNGQNRLAIVAEPAMLNWLEEYAAVEDYGYSRLAPLNLNPVRSTAWAPSSTLSWYIPPAQLKNLSPSAHSARMRQHRIDPSLIGLSDIQAAQVKHCHGARATSLTLSTGFKVSYSGDCRPSKVFSHIGKGSTVCIHEATFDDELQGDAEAKNHSTTSEALTVAQDMGAKACVLTHFSQRYQKVPVLERAEQPVEAAVNGNEDVTMEDDGTAEESVNADDSLEGPIEDAAAPTFPDQETFGSGQQYELPSNKSRQVESGPPEAVKFKLNSDMKVCVAFDYMRVKVGDIGHMEKFTPALLQLFAQEVSERDQDRIKKGNDHSNGGGGGKKGKQEKQAKKGDKRS